MGNFPSLKSTTFHHYPVEGNAAVITPELAKLVAAGDEDATVKKLAATPASV
jgi:hypothetical protein